MISLPLLLAAAAFGIAAWAAINQIGIRNKMETFIDTTHRLAMRVEDLSAASFNPPEPSERIVYYDEPDRDAKIEELAEKILVAMYSKASESETQRSPLMALNIATEFIDCCDKWRESRRAKP